MGSSQTSAVDAALGALRHRDLSVAALEQRLAARGFSDAEREDALATLQRTGLVDDRRYAELRARTLVARGAGDALVRHDLELAGVDREHVDHALELLEPERERARNIVARRGTGAKTARYLAGKGFSEEAISSAGSSSGAACATGSTGAGGDSRDSDGWLD